MSTPDLTRRLRKAREKARAEQQRAVRARTIAERHARLLADASDATRPVHQRMVEIHRDLQQTHQEVVRLHRAHACRLQSQLDGATEAGVGPLFMAAVADTLDAGDALLNLMVPAGGLNAVATSSARAGAVQELEQLLDEGPAHSVAGGRPLVVSSPGAMSRRWPRYGPAVSDLGVASVSALELATPHSALGSLVVLDPGDPRGRQHRSRLRSVGAALTEQILTEFDDADPDPAASPVLAHTDYHDEIHQATGMIMAQADCSAADALAMLKAHAFAEGMGVGALAAKVLVREIRFDEL